MKTNRVFRNFTAVTVLAVTFALFTASSAQATNMYMTGFEPNDGFTLGPLNGQEGWVGNGADIEATTVYAGRQALHINASSVPGFYFANAPVTYPISRQYSIVRLAFLAQDNCEQCGLAVSGDTGFLAQIAIFGDSYCLGNTNSATPCQSFPAGVWHQLVMTLDFLNQTATATIDDIPLGTLALNPPLPPTAVSVVQIYSFFVNGPPNHTYADQLDILTAGKPLD